METVPGGIAPPIVWDVLRGRHSRALQVLVALTLLLAVLTLVLLVVWWPQQPALATVELVLFFALHLWNRHWLWGEK